MLRVGVVFGGRSTEHNVSLRSGTFIYNTLDRELFRVKPILLSESGKAYYPKEWNQDWNMDSTLSNELNGKEFSDSVLEQFQRNLSIITHDFWIDPSFGGCEAIAIGLHGGEGEDGRFQALMELAGIPYTGSGVLSSALAMDKYRSNLLFQQSGLYVAKNFDLRREIFYQFYDSRYPGKSWERIQEEIGIRLQFPIFSKPTTGGSSVGTFPAHNAIDWERKILEVFALEDRMLIQELIQGREVSCGVLEIPASGSIKSHLRVLPPTEIVPQMEFFNYEAKYNPGGSIEITPPNMPDEWIQSIQDYSLKAHRALGCVGYSRTDCIVTRDGTPWILETNTLPGMTGTSLIPQQAEKAGLEMKQIFTWLVQIALERKGIPIPWEKG